MSHTLQISTLIYQLILKPQQIHHTQECNVALANFQGCKLYVPLSGGFELEYLEQRILKTIV